MKKTSVIFSVLVAAILCVISFTKYNQDYGYVAGYPHYQTALDNNLGMTVAHLSSFLNEDTLVETTEKISDFFKTNELKGFIFVKEDDLENESITKSVYLYNSNINAYDHLLITPKTENFDWSLKKNGSYITNNPKDNEADGLIEYLDSSYLNFNRQTNEIINIYDLSLLASLDSKPMYYSMVFFIEPEKEGSIQNLLEDHFKDYFDWNVPQISYTNDVKDIVNFETTSAISDFFAMPKPVLYISSSALILVSVIIILKREKEITIRNLHGNRSSTIYFKILSKFILLNLIGFMAGFVLTLMVYTDNISILIIKYLKSTIPLLIIYFGVFIVSLALLFFYLSFKRGSKALKSVRSIKQFDISILLKIAVIVVLTIPLIQGINSMITNVKYLKEYSKPLKVKEISMIRSLYSENDIENKQMEVGFNTANEYGISYLSSSIYNSVSALKKEFKGDTSSLDFIGQAITISGNLPYQWPTLEANRHIGNYIELIGLDNKKLGAEDISKTALTFLVPESIADDFSNSGHVSYTESSTIIIKDPGRVYTSYMYDEYPAYVDNPIIAVVGSMNYFTNFSSNLFYSNENETDREHFSKFLNALDEQDISYYLTDGQSIYNDFKKISEDSLVETAMLIGISLLIIGLFGYFSATVYFDQFRKKLLVQYIHGKSYLDRYGLLYFTSIFAVVTSYIIVLLLSKFRLYFGFLAVPSITILFGVVLMIDISTLFYLVSKFEKKSISQMLKGDE